MSTIAVDGRTIVVSDDKGGGIEYADRSLPRGDNPFPRRWLRRGGLVGARDWILQNIAEDRARGIRPGTRQDEDLWLRDDEGGWELRRGVPLDPAGIAAQNRRRQMELLRHGPYGQRGH